MAAFLISYSLILTWASQSQKTDPHALTTPLALVFMVAVGIAYMGIPPLIHMAKAKPRPFLLLLVFVAGLIARVVTFGGETFFENDYFRYLWDGAVLANFHSPFGYAPSEVIDPGIVTTTKINTLIVLSEDAKGIMQNINYPFLSTVYPMVGQVFFALSYAIEPFSLNAWRLVLLAADVVNFLLLMHLLRLAGRSRLWASIYWLNPLIIGEFFNSAHVDLLIFPFLLLALIAAVRKWAFASVVLLALATAVKIWPILLLPLLLRPYVFTQFRKFFMLSLGFVLVCAVLFWPMIVSTFDQSSGLAAYAQSWQMNQTFYTPIFTLANLFTSGDVATAEYNAHRLARVIIALVVGTVAILVSLKPWNNVDQLVGRCLLIVLVMLALSPTQFPWYYCWLIPFLAIRPTNALMIITVTMPLYYSRFVLQAYEQTHNILWIYDTYLVWIIVIPAILLLFLSIFGPKLDKKVSV